MLRFSPFTEVYCNGYEADDVIGTLAYHKSFENKTKLIISSDHDFKQLINDNVHLFRHGQNDEIWDINFFKTELFKIFEV